MTVRAIEGQGRWCHAVRLALCALLVVGGLLEAGPGAAEDEAPGAARPGVVRLDALDCPIVESPPGDCTASELPRQETRVETLGNQCRFLDAQGQPVGDRWYALCGPELVSEAAVACSPATSNTGGCGLVDLRGEVVLPLIYQQIRLAPGSSIASILLNGRWGYFDIARRQMVFAPQFTRVSDFHEGIAHAEGPSDASGTLPGWIVDNQGQRLAAVPSGIQSVGRFVKGIARARIGDQWGYLDTRAQWVIAPQFLQATDFMNQFAMVRASEDPEQWAMIDRSGRGRLFLEGDSHRLTGWFGQGVELEYQCQVMDTAGTRKRCLRLCLGFDRQNPLESLRCASY